MPYLSAIVSLDSQTPIDNHNSVVNWLRASQQANRFDNPFTAASESNDPPPPVSGHPNVGTGLETRSHPNDAHHQSPFGKPHHGIQGHHPHNPPVPEGNSSRPSLPITAPQLHYDSTSGGIPASAAPPVLPVAAPAPAPVDHHPSQHHSDSQPSPLPQEESPAPEPSSQPQPASPAPSALQSRCLLPARYSPSSKRYAPYTTRRPGTAITRVESSGFTSDQRYRLQMCERELDFVFRVCDMVNNLMDNVVNLFMAPNYSPYLALPAPPPCSDPAFCAPQGSAATRGPGEDHMLQAPCSHASDSA